jgi:hypothetical protein
MEILIYRLSSGSLGSVGLGALMSSRCSMGNRVPGLTEGEKSFRNPAGICCLAAAVKTPHGRLTATRGGGRDHLECRFDGCRVGGPVSFLKIDVRAGGPGGRGIGGGREMI